MPLNYKRYKYYLKINPNVIHKEIEQCALQIIQDTQSRNYKIGISNILQNVKEISNLNIILDN